MTSSGENTLLTVMEAARLLNISGKQLRALTVAGEIRWINVGLGKKRPSRRYERHDIEAFKAEKAQRSCLSTNAKVERPIPMTSLYKVVDFQATLAQQQSAKRNASKPKGERPR